MWPSVVFALMFVSEGFAAQGYNGLAAGLVALTVLSIIMGGRSAGAGRKGSIPLAGLPILLFAGIWLARLAIDFRQMGIALYGIKIVSAWGSVFGVWLLLARTRALCSARTVIFSLTIGLSVYCAVNLVADRVFGLVASQHVIEQFASRFEEGSFRWFPPLVYSNGLFCQMIGFLIALLIRAYFLSPREKSIYVGGVLLLALVPILYAAKIAEFRATLVAPILSIIWLLLVHPRLRRLFDILIMITGVIIPVCFINFTGAKILETLVPAKLIEDLGQSSEGFYTLSARAYLYEYAMARILESSVIIFGEGPARRDASVALPYSMDSSADYRMSYHNAFWEIAISNGAILTFLFVVGIVLIIRRLFAIEASITSGKNKWMDATLGVSGLACASAAGLIDTAYGHFPIFAISVGLALYVISRHSHQNLGPATEHPQREEGRW